MTPQKGRKKDIRINKGEKDKIIQTPSEARTIPFMHQPGARGK